MIFIAGVDSYLNGKYFVILGNNNKKIEKKKKKKNKLRRC